MRFSKNGSERMSIKVDTKGLEEDLLRYMKTFSKAYAQESCKQITQKAQACIEMFYRDYTPYYYDRTFDLLRDSYVPYLHNNGKAYYGGVRITSDLMSLYYSGGFTSHTSTDPIIIAQSGWHGDPTGYNGRFTPIRTASPLDVLTKFVYSENLITAVSKYADKKAKKQTYKYLNDFFNR